MFDRSDSHAIILALDTCGNGGSAALGRLDLASNRLEILGKSDISGRTYSAQLIPKIEQLLAGCQATVQDIRAIVVVRGPGSFTGIRVGLSAAKGLAEAVGAGIVAVSRLALLADVSGLPHVLAAIDAGRGEYYVGEYQDGQNLRETLLSRAELLTVASEPAAGILVHEGGSGTAEDVIASKPVYVIAPDAADALSFALDRLRSGSFDDVETLDANYLRRPDAEIFGATGTGVRKSEGAISKLP